MAVCDMCGAENRLYKAQIEGSILNVCQHCARFGKVLANIHDKRFVEKMQKKQQSAQIPRPAPVSEELVESIVENYSELIKKRREELSLTQEDFAKKINEKESIIHKIETGHFEPNILLARKIERFLKLKLIEQVEAKSADAEKPTKTEAFTLGDFIKIRKRE
jgi:putative transcription factor